MKKFIILGEIVRSLIREDIEAENIQEAQAEFLKQVKNEQGLFFKEYDLDEYACFEIIEIKETFKIDQETLEEINKELQEKWNAEWEKEQEEFERKELARLKEKYEG